MMFVVIILTDFKIYCSHLAMLTCFLFIFVKMARCLQVFTGTRGIAVSTLIIKNCSVYGLAFFFVFAVIKSTVAEASGTSAQKQAKLPDGWDLLCTAQHFPADNA